MDAVYRSKHYYSVWTPNTLRPNLKTVDRAYKLEERPEIMVYVPI